MVKQHRLTLSTPLEKILPRPLLARLVLEAEQTRDSPADIVHDALVFYFEPPAAEEREPETYEAPAQVQS